MYNYTATFVSSTVVGTPINDSVLSIVVPSGVIKYDGTIVITQTAPIVSVTPGAGLPACANLNAGQTKASAPGLYQVIAPGLILNGVITYSITSTFVGSSRGSFADRRSVARLQGGVK